MAHNMRLLWRSTKDVIHHALFRNTTSNVTNPRYLYTDSVLKVIDYEKSRQTIRAQYLVVEDAFRTKMKAVCDNTDATLYLEDLKAMTHIVQKTTSDLELFASMIKKFCASAHVANQTYYFGPVIMRAYYFLNEPQEAYNMLMAPEHSHFFNKYNSYIVLMALLYKNGMYTEIINVWNRGEEMNPTEPLSNDRRRVLLYAALAKLNTPEALKMAEDVWTSSLTRFRKLSVREINLYSYILLQHNKLVEALLNCGEIRFRTRINDYVKLRCLLGLGEYEKAYDILKHLADEQRTHCLWTDLREIVDNIPASEIQERMLDLWPTLTRNGAFFINPFEQYIFNPINTTEISAEQAKREERLQNRGSTRMRRLLV